LTHTLQGHGHRRIGHLTIGNSAGSRRSTPVPQTPSSHVPRSWLRRPARFIPNLINGMVLRMTLVKGFAMKVRSRLLVLPALLARNKRENARTGRGDLATAAKAAKARRSDPLRPAIDEDRSTRKEQITHESQAAVSQRFSSDTYFARAGHNRKSLLMFRFDKQRRSECANPGRSLATEES
jgi:hypothetical protein